MGNVCGKSSAQPMLEENQSSNKAIVFGKLSARQQHTLDEIFKDLLRRASIDYSNREIRDIQAAVHTILERVVAKVNERGIFKVSRIHPCGSMAEKNIALEV